MADDSCEFSQFPISDEEAAQLLKRFKTIAVVGLSHIPEKPSHYVPQYMQAHGYRIIPVNPTVEGKLLGETVYPSLKEIPEKVEIVNIFRLPKHIPAIVEDAIAIGAKAVWMQLGIAHNAAAQRAKARGLEVVMDKCMMVVHRNYGG